MTIQQSVAVRNAQLEAVEIVTNGQTLTAGTGSGGTLGGTAAPPRLQFHTGAMPANCAAARTGTLLVNTVLPANWMADSSAGAKSIAGGPWALTGLPAAGAGTVAGYYSVMDNAGTTCHEQGTIGVQVQLSTNALTAANSNVLNFASTTGVVVGMNAAGAGVPATATVVALTATTVTLSHTSTAGVANAAAITFTADMTVDNASVANAQVVNVSAKSITAPNA